MLVFLAIDLHPITSNVIFTYRKLNVFSQKQYLFRLLVTRNAKKPQTDQAY